MEAWNLLAIFYQVFMPIISLNRRWMISGLSDHFIDIGNQRLKKMNDLNLNIATGDTA
jgi:hypothetical protein